MRLLALMTLVGLGCIACDANTEGGSGGGSTTTGVATNPTTEPTTVASSGTAATSATTTGDTDATAETTAAATSTADATGAVDTGSADSTESSGTSLCDNGNLDPGEVAVDCGGDCGACPTGSACDGPTDCDSAVCESGSCLGDADGCELDDVQGAPGGLGWADSYSVDGRCYCATTFDHDIGGVVVDTPAGPRTVMEVCEAIGDGPGIDGHPIYNDIQCGNGPANDAGDEDWCPGRVDQGEAGCCTAGPLWDLSVFER